MALIQRMSQVYLRRNPDIIKGLTLDDPSQLWKLMTEHKLQAIVQHLNKNFDLDILVPLRRRLQRRSKKMILSKLFQLKELISIQTTHEQAGIPILPYKGMAIGILFYKDINLRDFGDIDFAIAKNNIASSAEIMKSLGYVEIQGDSDFENLERSRSYHIDYSWVKYDDKGRIICNAEFHWQATNSALISPEEFEGLESKSQRTKILSKEVRLFSKLDNAYLMILHHGTVDGWFQLRHLMDLVVMLRSLSNKEVESLLLKLNEAKIIRSFYFGVQLSRDILKVNLNMVTVPSLPWYKHYLTAVQSGGKVGKWSENKDKLFYYLQLQDNYSQRMKAVRRFLKFSFRELNFKLTKALNGTSL